MTGLLKVIDMLGHTIEQLQAENAQLREQVERMQQLREQVEVDERTV